MNNYVYIIAGLPVISSGQNLPEGVTAEGIIEQIKSQCSRKDCEVIDFLLSGFKDENLNEEFYRKALSHNSGFIREYFRFDLNLRNAKVRYINESLDRPENMDIMDVDGGVFEEKDKASEILHGIDILERERGLDDLSWEKINGMTIFNYFDMTVILAFIAKLNIIDRWLRLDEERGRELFRNLVNEVRGTFKGVEFNA